MTHSPFNHTKSQLVPGVWLSPGFYLAYWENHINKLFTPKEIIERVELKQHREVWVGSIFAAAQFRASGIQHFVGLPSQEPPDVEVVRFLDTATAKGTPGTKVERIPLEVTRCNMAKGETLLGQIEKKNKPAYEGMSLLVYEYGSKKVSDYEAVHEALKQKEHVYFDTIISVAQVDHTANGLVLPDGTFAVTMLYPRKGQTPLNVSDPKAFFRYPEVVTKTQLAAGTQWEELGSYELLAPALKNKRKARP